MAHLFLLLISFPEQALAISMKSNYLIFYFMDCVFGVVYERSLPNPRSQIFSLIFPHGSFIELGILFGSMIHSEILFV